MGSKVFKRLRKSTEGKHSRYGSVKVTAPSGAAGGGGGGGGGRAAQADEVVRQYSRVMRRDEREILVSGQCLRTRKTAGAPPLLYCSRFIRDACTEMDGAGRGGI